MFKKAIFILLGSFVLSGAVFSLETEDAVIAELQAVGDKLTSLDKILMAGGLSHEKMMELSLKVVKLEEKEKKLRQTLEEYESSKKEEVAELSESEKITEEVIEGTYNHASLKAQEETASSSEESKSLGSKFKESANKAVNLLKDAVLGAKAEAQEDQNQGTQAMCVGHYIEQGVNLVKSDGVKNRYAGFCNHVILLKRLHKGALEELAGFLVSRGGDLLRRLIKKGFFGLMIDSVKLFTEADITLVKKNLAATVFFLEKINEHLNRQQPNLITGQVGQNNLLHLVGYILKEHEFGSSQTTRTEVVTDEVLIGQVNQLFSEESDFKTKIIEIIRASEQNLFAEYLNLTNVEGSPLNKISMPALVASLTCDRRPIEQFANKYNKMGDQDYKTPLAVALDGFVETFRLGIANERALPTAKIYNNYMASLMEIGKANSWERYDFFHPNNEKSVIGQAEVDVEVIEGDIRKSTRLIQARKMNMLSESGSLKACLEVHNRQPTQ